ncbi:protein of unassigned function [Methylobacterium oryzae CBMB20]|uniref:Protein of unassigned function n=1 Tax=Methylobacterium oryzae CBMB20 TaxID=693986 RepID=A0A089P0A8_9HYPH|nr:protein of unassigned function [Methylobacterium oryzae CBMB20]
MLRSEGCPVTLAEAAAAAIRGFCRVAGSGSNSPSVRLAPSEGRHASEDPS